MTPSDRYSALFAPLAEASAREAWLALQERSAQRSPFTDLRFADALGGGDQSVRIALVMEGDAPAAGLLVYHKRRGPYRAASLPLLANSNGVVLAEVMRDADVNYRRTALDTLLSLIGREYHQATLALHPSLEDVRPFTWSGWTVEPRYTYVVALPSAGAPDAWSSTHRHAFTRHRDEYDVELSDASIEVVVQQITEAYTRRNQRFPVPADELSAVVNHLQSTGLAKLAIARRGGEVEAGLILLGDGDTVHYWLGGSAPGPAMTVLLGRAIEHLLAIGVARLDLTGANVPTIAEFKRKFGAERKTYFRARLVTRPELHILDAVRHSSSTTR